MNLAESDLILAPKNVLAIDPGLSGAVWSIGRGDFSGRRDFKGLPQISFAIRDLQINGGPDLVVIEHVHAMPKQGVCSMFSFGKAAGFAEAALALCLPPKCPVQTVEPQAWQNFFRVKLGLPKKAEFESRSIASKLFPSHTQYFKRVLDHNSADAVLMAVWGLCQLC